MLLCVSVPLCPFSTLNNVCTYSVLFVTGPSVQGQKEVSVPEDIGQLAAYALLEEVQRGGICDSMHQVTHPAFTTLIRGHISTESLAGKHIQGFVISRIISLITGFRVKTLFLPYRCLRFKVGI